MKKFHLAMLAVVIAVASAFTFKPQTYTFRYDGSTTSGSERIDETRYTYVTPSCSGDENVLCAIIAAKDVNNKPVITSGTTLYNHLYNSNSSVGPNFSTAAVIGKTP